MNNFLVQDGAARMPGKGILRNPTVIRQQACVHLLVADQFYRQPIDIQPCEQLIHDWQEDQLTKQILSPNLLLAEAFPYGFL